tara:strand:+ start:645 stop:1877 length:1233 start_codon:yes stop_codon:yes gene_type:complete
MKITKTAIINTFVFIILYFTFIIGFILNEDSAGGAIQDYSFHLGVREFFLDDTLYGLKNYLETEAVHSPIFIIFLKYLLFLGEDFGRLVFLNCCIIIVFLFFICLKKIYNVNISFLFLLSNFFFLSPYFRSSAIWPGDENLALIFFVCSVYFYNSFFKKKDDNGKFISIFFNIFFLALAAYFRPIYALFSFFYFYQLILKNFNLTFLLFYTIVNLILSFPAFYYVFFMKVTFFYDSVGSFNFINSFSLTYTVLLFYLIPFLIFYEKKTIFTKFNIFSLIFSILITLIVVILFNYNTSTGGGIFYMAQKIFFSKNYFYGLIFLISFIYVNKFLEIKKISNLILIITLLFFEMDNHFYMETYDPLFFICLFLLFKTNLINSYMRQINLKRITFLYTYLLSFYFIKVSKLYLL